MIQALRQTAIQAVKVAIMVVREIEDPSKARDWHTQN